MNKNVAAFAALGILISLSGCGSASTVADKPSVAASESPTPTRPSATAAQFASVIAEDEKGWRDYNDNIGDCAWSRVIGKTTIDRLKVTTCSLNLQTVTLTAQTTIRNLNALGNPPAEISPLVTRTILALTPLGAIDATTACEDMISQSCSDAETEANGAIRPVVSVLDAWRPYTH